MLFGLSWSAHLYGKLNASNTGLQQIFGALIWLGPVVDAMSFSKEQGRCSPSIKIVSFIKRG